jgi:hypothetical protein
MAPEARVTANEESEVHPAVRRVINRINGKGIYVTDAKNNRLTEDADPVDLNSSMIKTGTLEVPFRVIRAGYACKVIRGQMEIYHFGPHHVLPGIKFFVHFIT